MKLNQILGTEKVTLSFEVFPPKTFDKYESVMQAVRNIAILKPDFMSVTYGAGGGTSDYTVSIASTVQSELQVPALAHLTCASADRAKVHEVLTQLRARGIENVLALRGDIPEGGRKHFDYMYASDLVREIKEFGDFCVGGACYPEGHPESPTRKEDIRHLKEKVDAGCEFLTTQMFFENDTFFQFLYLVREAGIRVPVVAGIMPITRASQIEHTMKLSGSTRLPKRFTDLVDRFGDKPAAMEQAGIAYATDQIIDLIANGINNIHVYSMNKPAVARKIQENLSEILKG